MPTANSSVVTSVATAQTGGSTMKAAVYKGDSVVEVESIPVPAIGSGEVLIRVEACGICPTDLKKIAYNLLPGPRVFTSTKTTVSPSRQMISTSPPRVR